MSKGVSTVKITAANIDAAIALAEPIPESASGSYRVTTLEFSAKEPSRFAKMFNSGDGITVTVDPSPVEGGAFLWSTQVRFPRGTDIEREFARVGLDWPAWWAIPDMTHLVEKARIVDFVGFAWPELALPWFVRLHAAATGVDALAPGDGDTQREIPDAPRAPRHRRSRRPHRRRPGIDTERLVQTTGIRRVADPSSRTPRLTPPPEPPAAPPRHRVSDRPDTSRISPMLRCFGTGSRRPGVRISPSRPHRAGVMPHRSWSMKPLRFTLLGG